VHVEESVDVALRNLVMVLAAEAGGFVRILTTSVKWKWFAP